MQNKKLKRFIYALKHRYITMNNVVLALAAVIAISWAWASVQAVQRNYALQREVDDKRRQQQLVELQTDSLQFEQRYYKSSEYLALESKRRLGLAEQGERVLVLPPNSAAVIAADKAQNSSVTTTNDNTIAPSPLEQWTNFLFGGNRQAAKNSQ